MQMQWPPSARACQSAEVPGVWPGKQQVSTWLPFRVGASLAPWLIGFLVPWLPGARNGTWHRPVSGWLLSIAFGSSIVFTWHPFGPCLYLHKYLHRPADVYMAAAFSFFGFGPWRHIFPYSLELRTADVGRIMPPERGDTRGFGCLLYSDLISIRQHGTQLCRRNFLFGTIIWCLSLARFLAIFGLAHIEACIINPQLDLSSNYANFQCGLSITWGSK